MKTIDTEILVIGGGATGAGILRDLAMRGFRSTLVEKGDLTTGTTGRYHGLLHSGGRYVVKDPQAAIECIEENRILRRIMPHCIEDTGGFFVLTPWDEPEYAPRFVAGCKQANISVEELSLSQMLLEEPLLNPQITRCFRVPDASADSFLATDLNAESARQHRAQVYTYHKVTQILRSHNRVSGAICHDLEKDEFIQINADLVINASGAWAGQIAAMAGLNVHVIPGKGVMLAMNHRIVNTVINRCKMPSDGDILVPAHTVSVIGTTDVKVEDPDHFAIEPWEVHLMLEEGDKMIPGFRKMRMLRAWGGVRPLYQETDVEDTRDVTRAFVLLNHAARDGVDGLITITSGKWTTYRKMAEATVDLACKLLGTSRSCRTALEMLPAHRDEKGYHYLGARLKQIEQSKGFGQLVCECELATRADVEFAITQGQAKTIDDIRRDARLGMGPCQGGFCTVRAAGILHQLRHPEIEHTNVALRDFLQERWKGLMPVLWDQQLRQERLDELIYLSILNTDHLPGPFESRLSPLQYSSPAGKLDQAKPLQPAQASPPVARVSKSQQLDVLVLGAGLAGLVTALQAALHGKRVRLISKGQGALFWQSGCIDVIGYEPHNAAEAVFSPAEALARLVRENPLHPYAIAGINAVEQALLAFQYLCAQQGYPMLGSIDQNWLLPSALGAIRPTCLAPETMIAGDLQSHEKILLIGFKDFHDFFPELAADNLSHQGHPATALRLELPWLNKHTFITSRVLAEAFENPEFQHELIQQIKAHLGNNAPRPGRIGFPAVLGLNSPLEIKRSLEDQLDLPVFEIPTLPPSIPGIRLSRLLVKALERAGGQIFDGMQAESFDTIAADHTSQIQTIYSEAASRKKAHRAQKYVLATGGILGGGTIATYEGLVREVICGLAVQAPATRTEWFDKQFLSPKPHPIFTAGISVNGAFQPLQVATGNPIEAENQPIYANLYAVGTALAGGDYIRERSFDGVGLVTGYYLGSLL